MTEDNNMDLLLFGMEGLTIILIKESIIGFQNRVSSFRVLRRQFDIPVDVSINEEIDEINKNILVLWGYMNKYSNNPQPEKVQKVIEESLDKEYLDSLSNKIDNFPLESYIDDELPDVDHAQFLRAYVSFNALSTMVDMYIVKTLQDYASTIGDEEMLVLMPRPPSRFKDLLFGLTKGYRLEKI